MNILYFYINTYFTTMPFIMATKILLYGYNLTTILDIEVVSNFSYYKQ